MISIYLDWNVMAQLKNGLNPKLKEVLDTDRFLMPYSTSHIDDILASYSDNPEQLAQINTDLEFISALTKNYCLSNDSKVVRLDFTDPKELFQDRVDEKDLFRNFSLDSLTNIIEGNELEKDIYKQAIEHLKNLPLDKAFIEAFNNPQTSEQMNTLFPGLKDNPTYEGFFKVFGEMITRMNETEDYKKLRNITQTGLGIKRDKIFSADDPYKIIIDTYEKFKIDPKTFLPESGKYAPAWFDEISNEYIKLDMHGYQEDKVNTTKGRKETFRNTTEDSFHAAFASTCHFYITNDKKSFEKTQKVYEQISVNTFVFKPDEFLEYYKVFLTEGDITGELQIPLKFIETDKYIENQIEGGQIRSYHVPYFIFDFFNKMTITLNKSGRVTMIMLSQIPPTNMGITYFFEIEKLSPKLYAALGMDTDNLGQITLEELEQDEWVGRKWSFDNLSFRFIRLNGHYQLYYDYPNDIEGV
jgi:hypothetical protein